MVLTKVSGDWISMISEMGATSSLAATLGSRFYQTERREDPRLDQRHNISVTYQDKFFNIKGGSIIKKEVRVRCNKITKL